MKKILEIIIGTAFALSLVIAGGERPDGTFDFFWTASWATFAVILGEIWVKFFSQEPVHITDEAYNEIQRQIQDAVDCMSDGRAFFTFEADLPDEMRLSVEMELSASTTRRKFTDDAWGRPETHTESRWVCQCTALSSSVLDKDGKSRKNDFKDSYLELRFETVDWD